MDQELRKMEDAAMRSYARDMSSMADLTAQTITAVMRGGAGTSKPIGPQVDPLMPPDDFDAEREGDARRSQQANSAKPPSESSMWVEAKSPEGHPYYWNVRTNETLWVPPKEGFMPLDEYNRINDIAVAQQQLQIQEESKNFRENADEIVAKYRREQLKVFRRTDPDQKKKAEEERTTFKTEEDAEAPAIGVWQTVGVKKEPEPVDLQLPPRPHDYYYVPAVSNPEPEPLSKRFKEKTIEHLDSEVASTAPATFKKRKIAKGNARQRLDVD